MFAKDSFGGFSSCKQMKQTLVAFLLFDSLSTSLSHYQPVIGYCRSEKFLQIKWWLFFFLLWLLVDNNQLLLEEKNRVSSIWINQWTKFRSLIALASELRQYGRNVRKFDTLQSNCLTFLPYYFYISYLDKCS